LALTGESVRIRSFRDDRGHFTAWPLLRNEIPPGAATVQSIKTGQAANELDAKALSDTLKKQGAILE
jgi:hypothetical protein